MKKISLFSFKQQSGPYETWSLRSKLLKNGQCTGKSIPGYLIDAQYAYKNLYLLVVSYNFPYEESHDFLLLSKDLDILSKKHVGQIHSSIVFKSHSAISEDQVIFHCNNNLEILVTCKSGLLHPYLPFITIKKIHQKIMHSAC